jgi:hypothetical protein
MNPWKKIWSNQILPMGKYIYIYLHKYTIDEKKRENKRKYTKKSLNIKNKLYLLKK